MTLDEVRVVAGGETLEAIKSRCEVRAKALGLTVDFRQTNTEGELVSWIQAARGQFAGIIINAGAYTHTSVAIHDALRLGEAPITGKPITSYAPTSDAAEMYRELATEVVARAQA